MKCPKCKRDFQRLLAISRDTGVSICSECATEEALKIAVSNGVVSSTQAEEIMEKVKETEADKNNSNS